VKSSDRASEYGPYLSLLAALALCVNRQNVRAASSAKAHIADCEHAVIFLALAAAGKRQVLTGIVCHFV
jgi:hypothetical protein